jgi:single-strand DNA-binding protein
MNNVVLVGRLTRDPELRTTPNGIATCQISLAVNGLPNQNGERTTDFIDVQVWRRQAENVSKYCTKGSQVGVVGRIHTRSYDANDGTKRYVTEVVADNVTFLGSKGNGTGSNGGFVDAMPDYNTVSQPSYSSSTDLTDDPFKDFGSEVVLSDDDLPF